MIDGIKKVPEEPNILFINPPSLRLIALKDKFTYPFPYVPYGPLHVATYVEKHGFKVKVYNADFNVRRVLDKNEEVIWDEVRNVLRKLKPDVLGISMRTLQYRSAIRTAQIARELNSDVVVVVGGWHPTFMPKETIQEKSFDFVVRREGEETFLELIKALIDGKPLNRVRGIAYREGKRIFLTPERPLIQNLDVLPFPNRELLIYKKYYPYLEISTITPSRGCTHHCTFCPSNAFWGYRTRSAKNIVDEIEYLKNKYGMEEFWFLSESFFINKKNVLSFYEELKKRRLDIIWGGMARVDELDRDLVRKLKSVGLYNISLGAETGSQKILDITKKGITIEQIRNAVKLLKEEGIFVYTYWMVGYQEETMETLEATKNLIKTLDSDDVDIVFMIPFPGTEEFEKAKSANRLASMDWPEYHLRNPYLLNRPYVDTETLYNMYKDVFVRLQAGKEHHWVKYLVKHPKMLSKKLQSIIKYKLLS
ncbi:MAG: radical SAM protein [Thermoplasmata archaeon]|nr:radical SAM protein [Thermoplasmata archaeon]